MIHREQNLDVLQHITDVATGRTEAYMNGQELALNPQAISAASSVLAPLVMISPIAYDIISSTLREMEVEEHDEDDNEVCENRRNTPFDGIVSFLGESKSDTK